MEVSKWELHNPCNNCNPPSPHPLPLPAPTWGDPSSRTTFYTNNPQGQKLQFPLTPNLQWKWEATIQACGEKKDHVTNRIPFPIKPCVTKPSSFQISIIWLFLSEHLQWTHAKTSQITQRNEMHKQWTMKTSTLLH